VITWDDMSTLLGLMAVYDQRKGGDLDVDAWFAASEAQGWDDAEAVRRIIVEHYSRPIAEGERRQRLDPAAVSTRLREIHRKIMSSFVDPKIPAALPAGMTYPQWLRSQQQAHKREGVRVWAVTGEEPRPAATIEPMGNRLPEILAAAPEHVRPEIEAGLRSMVRRKP
jgi:hypothetical protein